MISRASCFPRLYAAASLKHERLVRAVAQIEEFSAALCRGLIEASDLSVGARVRFPRLYAAASLFRNIGVRLGAFSAALCRGLIEADRADRRFRTFAFSAALCRGLIEAMTRSPRVPVRVPFSAALCRGLIEARASSRGIATA